MMINFRKKCLAGFFIGVAIIAPGVSGAVIAMLFNLYDDIIFNISSINKKSILFLLPILISAFFGFIFGFLLLKKLLIICPFIISLLFCGLLLGSSSNLLKGKLNFINFIIGLIIPIILTLFFNFSNFDIDIFNNSINTFFINVIIGFIISLTQFIPGGSASSFLISIGAFNKLINSFCYDKCKYYLFIFIGVVIGVIIIGKFLNKLIKSNRNMDSIYYALAISSSISIIIAKDNILIYKGWLYFGVNYLELISGVLLFIMGFLLAKWLFFSKKQVN